MRLQYSQRSLAGVVVVSVYKHTCVHASQMPLGWPHFASLTDCWSSVYDCQDHSYLHCILKGNLVLQVPLSEVPWSTNDENYVGFSVIKMGNKQPAFTIHEDEPDDPKPKKHVSKKNSPNEEILGLKAAIASLGTRKPLTPIDNPMDYSSGEN